MITEGALIIYAVKTLAPLSLPIVGFGACFEAIRVAREGSGVKIVCKGSKLKRGDRFENDFNRKW